MKKLAISGLMFALVTAATVVMFFLVSTTASAQSLVLGELKGTGSFKVQITDETSSSGYESKCDIALNIRQSENSFSIPFSVFHCGGVNVWNEELAVGIKDSKVFQLNAQGEMVSEIGQIESDGTIGFTLETKRNETDVEYLPGFNCSPSNTDAVTKHFELSQKWTYAFKKNADSSYTFVQKVSDEAVVGVNKRVNNCNYISYIKRTTESELDGSVAKP